MPAAQARKQRAHLEHRRAAPLVDPLQHAVVVQAPRITLHGLWCVRVAEQQPGRGWASCIGTCGVPVPVPGSSSALLCARTLLLQQELALVSPHGLAPARLIKIHCRAAAASPLQRWQGRFVLLHRIRGFLGSLRKLALPSQCHWGVWPVPRSRWVVCFEAHRAAFPSCASWAWDALADAALRGHIV